MSDAASKPFVKNPIYERWRWQIFAITWLAYAAFYLTRKSFAVAKIGMKKSVEDGGLGMSPHSMALLDSTYLIAYAVGQFIWGITADKVGARKVVLVGLLGSVFAAAVMGASDWVIFLGILQCVQGLSQSTGWGPLTKNFGAFFSQHERGTKMGWWSTCYAVGGLVAAGYAGYWADQFGRWGFTQSWRFAFYMPAATLFVVFILFLIFQRNRPEDVGLPPVEEYHGEKPIVLKPGEAPEEEPEGSWKVIWEVISNKTVLLLGVCYFLLKPARYSFILWGPMYVNDRLGTGMWESGSVSGLYDGAGVISCILGGWMSDKLFKSKRMPVCIMFLFALGIFLFFFDHLPRNIWIISGAFFLAGLLSFAPDSIISGTAAMDFGTRKGAGTAAGLINGFGSIAAVLGGLLPGFIEKPKEGEINIFYQLGFTSWNAIFTVFGVMMIIAAIILLPKWHAMPPVKNPEGTKKN